MSRKIGIIGGSGLYEMEGLQNKHDVEVDTPFGKPSAPLLCGSFEGVDAELFFLPRHGRGHVFNPSEVPYRANIFAMKKLGVEWIISVSAVGSLREQIVPGHVVLIDQFIDRTKSNRPCTFYENGIVAHVGFADPVCETLRGFLLEAAKESGATAHDGGTYVCMEGPAFSTRAESHLYRSWGANVIGMTNVTEAKLAREAEISYATIAMSTDYDCWHEGHDDVTVEQVVAVINANVSQARKIIRNAIPKILSHDGPAPYSDALAFAIMTSKEKIPSERIEELRPLVGKYLP
jgi:5'-methylthioadenosine phosphorylase